MTVKNDPISLFGNFFGKKYPFPVGSPKFQEMKCLIFLTLLFFGIVFADEELCTNYAQKCTVTQFRQGEETFSLFINALQDAFNARDNATLEALLDKTAEYLTDDYTQIARRCNGSIREEFGSKEEFIEEEFFERCCSRPVKDVFFHLAPATL